jgi:peptidoglycan/LPS O-acetylase OafA/YrhL
MVWTRNATTSASPNGNSTEYRLSWDVIRVIAIGAVLLFHATYWGPLVSPGIAEAPFQMPLQFGASTLLVVSGFFAAKTIRKYSGFRWWLRRMARLLPAYLVAVVVVFASAHLFAPAEYYHPNLVDLVGNLLLLHMWIPGVNWVDGSFWTLPVQVGAFTAIAVLAYLGGVRGRRTKLTLWVVLLVPLVIRATALQHEPPLWLQIMMDGSGIGRAHLFVAGIAIWLWSSRRISVVHLITLLGVVLAAQAYHPPIEDSVVGLGIMLALICLATGGADWTVRGLGRLARPIRWLAGISYGVYLMHQNIGYLIARRFTELGLSPWLSLAAFIGSAVTLGWLLTVLVERPAFRVLSRRIHRAESADHRAQPTGEAAERRTGNESTDTGSGRETAAVPEPLHVRCVTLITRFRPIARRRPARPIRDQSPRRRKDRQLVR